MQKSIILTYKSTRREFTVSNKTKPHHLKGLIHKAMHLQSDVRCLRNSDGGKVSFDELFGSSRQNQFEVVLEDESSCDHSKNSHSDYSQKRMSKISGRKNPPSENELLQSKFYIDDLQLFMSEVQESMKNRYFGIVFFNAKRTANFLGRKILRELVFEFDQIEFFYALHPIKVHSSSKLLGEVCLFSIFKGQRMIHEREFPQQITAADDIPNYIRNLIKIGQLSFKKNANLANRNLISLQEQRSFDANIQNFPDHIQRRSSKPERTPQNKTFTVPGPNANQDSPFTYHASPINVVTPVNLSPARSPLTNQISFENQFYQPDWFSTGDALTRLEKAFIAALIKRNDSNLIVFCQGLDFKNAQKRALHIKLMKVFVQEIINQKLQSAEARQFIEKNQENRSSFVFSSLLKLAKFGDIVHFVSSMEQNILKESSYFPQINIKKQVSYSSLAKEGNQSKNAFTLKLVNCEKESEQFSPREACPFRKSLSVHMSHLWIAEQFHGAPIPKTIDQSKRKVHFPPDYDEAEKAAILDLIFKHDAFLIECFVDNHLQKKPASTASSLPSEIVKKYLRESPIRYQPLERRTMENQFLSLKLDKLKVFTSLIYYLYKKKLINRKQLKIFLYLYTWSDLNVLGAFEVYLNNRCVQDFVDTFFAVDYQYYLAGSYQFDVHEFQHFTMSTQLQLVLLFLFEMSIESVEKRISLQKFIRNGDVELQNLLKDLNVSNEALIPKIQQLATDKEQTLQALAEDENVKLDFVKHKKQQRCAFIDQIVPMHFKGFKHVQIVKQLIMDQEPLISGIFQVQEASKQLVQWIESFKMYIPQIEKIHMERVIRQCSVAADLSLQKINACRTDVIKSIYHVHLQTNDLSDTADSLERAIRKCKVESPKAI